MSTELAQQIFDEWCMSQTPVLGKDGKLEDIERAYLYMPEATVAIAWRKEEVDLKEQLDQDKLSLLNNAWQGLPPGRVVFDRTYLKVRAIEQQMKAQGR
jgi:hypothetical protein